LFRRTSRRRDRTRAQGLVEFALVAPVLLVLLLVAIDFGRALYGWVVLQNSARIAANFAGLNADAWRYNVATTKARYALQITADLQAANCTSFGSGGGSGTPPDPTFVDGPDQAAAGGPADTIYDVGDVARVTLGCVFHPITPIISSVLGNNVQLSATSEFQIRTGMVTGLANPTEIPPPATPTPVPTPTPPGPTPTPTCNAATVNFTAIDQHNGGHPHRMGLSATISPSISGVTWVWTENSVQIATGQSPTVDFTSSGSHIVTLTATKASCTYTTTLTVTAP
jgi:hypothetical protein